MQIFETPSIIVHIYKMAEISKKVLTFGKVWCIINKSLEDVTKSSKDINMAV